jgi:hypothetical protein
MKSTQIKLMIVGFLLLALMATNPSIQDHRQAVIDYFYEKTSNSPNSGTKNKWQVAGEAIGMALGQGIIEKAVSRDNYILFSITTISFGDNKRKVGFGVFGKVFISNFNDLERTSVSENKEVIEESPSVENKEVIEPSSILGNTSKIGNIEIAQNDFPDIMYYQEAKYACEKLGDGWRLPSKDELNILFQNKDKIGNFLNKDYWSLTVKVDELTGLSGSDVWIQNFTVGKQYSSLGSSLCHTRAVRSL